jgi:hypothetical protein
MGQSNPLVTDHRFWSNIRKFEKKKKKKKNTGGGGAGLREVSEGGREGGRERGKEGEREKGRKRERPSTRWCSDTFLKTPFCLWFVVCKSSGLLALRLLPPEKKNTAKNKTILTNTASANERASERKTQRERERKTEFRDSRSNSKHRSCTFHLLGFHRAEMSSN